MDKIVGFVGAGSMAEALIAGIVKSEIVPKQQILVTNRSNQGRLKRLQQRHGILAMEEKSELVKKADIIFLAAKPYDIEESIVEIREYLRPDQLIISVAAGVETKNMEYWTGLEIPVIRAMPNTSAEVGCSATAIASGTYARDKHVQEAIDLLNTIGTTTVIAEEDMHVATAIAGSGPAFIYYMVEAMQKAAEDFGLNRETAASLLTQTVLGAGKMLRESGDSPEMLRKKITSPNGTTEAGIKTLDSYYFERIMKESIKNAKQRSIELGE